MGQYWIGADTPGAAQSCPLTHTAYIRTCAPQANQASGVPVRSAMPWVQVRQRLRGAPGAYAALCGQVIELSASDGQLFKVQIADGCVWAESRNVRLCSGDGLCTCEPKPSDTAEDQAPKENPC